MKTTKFLSLVLALVLSVCTITAIASESHIMLIGDAEAVTEYKITVDGAEIEKKAKTFDGVPMLPLRSLCEALGMEVSWDSETSAITIVKLPVYITCTTYADGYTFARTAPILLGTAPVLENGTTFVPLSFISEILHMDFEISADTIAVSTETQITSDAALAEMPKGEALITSAGEGQITLYDFARGEVIVNLGDDTEIFDAEGKKIEAKDIAVGVIAEIEYADFMTMSLPPITNALKITVKNDGLYELVTGTIDSVLNDNGKQVIIGETPMEQLAINVGADTLIVGSDGEAANADSLAKACVITSVVSNMRTRSIPPQTSAYFIRIEQ